ncbi:hypothetical protein BIW11_12827 [Tropilaelaps mercedesae]|uniref:Uncharacterized protein n=1 Tax=Tropilaelaps mercedesae TaxID=418985 RepID=A0A1V9X4M7_9ACAR|nr:hypothetical protein BIW11_12827 [Tropilaelaps mercedesae]
MGRKKRTSKLSVNVIHSSPYMSPALLSGRPPDQLLHLMQMQTQGCCPPAASCSSGHQQHSLRSRTSAYGRGMAFGGGGPLKQRTPYHASVSSRAYYEGQLPAFDSVNQSSRPFPGSYGPLAGPCDLSQMVASPTKVDFTPAARTIQLHCTSGRIAGTGLPPPACVFPPLGPSPLVPSTVASAPQSPTPGVGPSMVTSIAVLQSPWACDEGHELCPQFGLHQCACTPLALAREVVHDTPQPVPQPCFGSGEEILAISGSFPCLHFRFANLHPWLYYSICVEFAASAENAAQNYSWDSLLTQPSKSIRFLPPGNHMPGHLWMSRKWSLHLEQIALRIPHLPFGQFTPVVRLFATRGQLYQGLSLEGHPSDMIEASQNWFLSEHTFLLCPWAGDQRMVLCVGRVGSGCCKVDDVTATRSSIGRSLSDISDPYSLPESQSPPPCPREPWLDVEPTSCSSPDTVWGPPTIDGGCPPDDPMLHRIFNSLFPEGFFDETTCASSNGL